MPTELEILALGWSESDWIPYRAALDAIFHDGAKVVLRPDIPKRLDPGDVLRVELLICRVPADPAQHVRFVKFLTRVVDGYPYLPVVVVGSTEAMSTAFHAVKAARYLPGETSPSHLAREASRAIGGAWWYGVQAFDDPLLIVDRKGRIVRANPAARKRFGPEVVGKDYLPTVEKRSPEAWPHQHPIATTLGLESRASDLEPPAIRGWPAPKGESRYWEFPRFGPDAERAQLVCIPVLGLRNKVQAVCVLFVEMTRWVRSFQAASDLAQATDMDDLCRRIVHAVHDPATGLGYERVRLYVHNIDRRILKGKASCGFHPLRDERFQGEEGVDRETYFRTRFEFPIASDGPTTQIEKDRFPALCVDVESVSAGAGHSVTSEPDRQPHLVQYQFRRQYDRELDGPVTRWVDVPLMVPVITGEGLRFWGKLSVDRKSIDSQGIDHDRSEELGVKDVADLTLFAVVAASAIAVHESLQRLETGLDEFAATGKRLSHLSGEPHTPGEPPADSGGGVARAPIWSHVPPGTREVLKLFLQLTGAEVVYFRGNHRIRLSVERDGDGTLIEWRGGVRPSEVDIPPDVDLADHYSADLLTHIGPDGRWLSDIPPKPWYFTAPQTPEWEVTKETVRRRHYQWTPEQARILDWPYEVYVPVVIDGKFQGAFVGLSRHPLPGAADRAGWLLSVFSGAAGLWYELGVRKAEQAWWRPTLTELLTSLPDVIRQLGKRWQDDPLGNPFRHRLVYAGLAAMLTAHTGIGWNRCLIFRINESGTAAELVHAVGGLGEPDHEKRMAKVQEKKVDKLSKVVEPLLRQPEPRDLDTDELDPLYELCVQDAWAAGDAVSLRLDGSSILLDLLRRDPISGPATPGFLVFDPGLDGWCQEQERRFQTRLGGAVLSQEGHRPTTQFPRMFAATETYAFPLWGTFENEEHKPVALVLVDMAYRPHESVSARVPATSLFLNAVADKLAAYDHFVVGYVSAAAEYVLHHGHDLGSRWEELRNALSDDSRVSSEAETFEKEIQKLLEAMTKVKGHATDRDYEIRTSVPETLERLRNNWAGQVVDGKQILFSLNCEDGSLDNLSIACPPEVLVQAINELVTNAIRSVRDGEQIVNIEVRYRRRDCRLRLDHRPVVEIDVRDHGTGIDKALTHDIFLTGATARSDGERGRGLAQILRNVTIHGGYLHVYHPGGADHPLDRGAGFRLVFYTVTAKAPT